MSLKCSFGNCRRCHYALGFCHYHYNRSDVVRQKARAYNASERGKKNNSKKNQKYNRSFNGMMHNKLRPLNLFKCEEERAKVAFEKFDGKCQCCGSRRTNKLGWMLDHKGRRFRGILCVWCNCAAGFLKDNIGRCLKMIRYLRKTK